MKARNDRRVAFTVCWLLLLAGSGGCRNCDAVESELRIREQQNTALHAKLRQTELTNMALQRELEDQRTVLPPGTPINTLRPPEVAAQGTGVQRITLGRLTGGHSGKSKDGDDSLQVVVEPRDAADRIVKSMGSLQVAALEITPEGLKRSIGLWDTPAEQLEQKWRSGLFGSSYDVILPWQQLPASNRVRVVVRFTSADGRTFEAERDVTIRLGARPNPPTELPTPQGPIMGRASPLWKNDEPAANWVRTVSGAPPATPITPAATWQPAEPLPPSLPRLMSPIPVPDGP